MKPTGFLFCIRILRFFFVSNYFGPFFDCGKMDHYQDIPAKAFPYGITLQSAEEYSWLIACPEKALCDTLYLKKSVSCISDLKGLIFDSLRVEEADFETLNRKLLLFLAGLYPDRNLRLLENWMKKED